MQPSPWDEPLTCNTPSSCVKPSVLRPGTVRIRGSITKPLQPYMKRSTSSNPLSSLTSHSAPYRPLYPLDCFSHSTPPSEHPQTLRGTREKANVVDTKSLWKQLNHSGRSACGRVQFNRGHMFNETSFVDIG